MRLCLALAASMLAAPALADEAWVSNYGPVIWETDIGENAVFLLDETAQGHGRTRLVVPGLVLYVNGPRGAYSGVWIADSGEAPCTTEMIDPVTGAKSPHWGTFMITFVGTEFPYDWAGVWGACHFQPWDPISAEAVVGG